MTQSRKRADKRRERKTRSFLFKRQEPFGGVKEESTPRSGVDSAGRNGEKFSPAAFIREMKAMRQKLPVRSRDR